MTQGKRPRKKPKVTDINNWEPHKFDLDEEKENRWIFISKALDTYGLDVYEFRVLAHVGRRAGPKGVCNASQATIADCCGINQRKVMQALETLCQAKILEKTKTGRANHYKLNTSSKWERPEKLEEFRSKGEKKQEDTSTAD
jgi:Helix-turn-helix domain